jgi:site-specific DNA-methyltransferase (adenine-specific)
MIKNDRETIVMLRKPGGYRKPTAEMERLSRIGKEEYFRWFQPIWSDITGASTKEHPAPFPIELPHRLIRMFSFAGDWVLDPFVGTGTTVRAALRTGRNAIGLDVEQNYLRKAQRSIRAERSPRENGRSPIQPSFLPLPTTP